MQGYHDLTGRVALVTGASSGIGAHMSKAYSRSGARVGLLARRSARLEELKADIIAAGGQAEVVVADVRQEADIIRAFDTVEAAFGPVDTVLANAGIIGPSDRSTDVDIDDFDDVLAVNLRGVFLTCREAARRLIANGSKQKQSGRIVIISSVDGKKTYLGYTPYAASKAGVSHMGRMLAREWAGQGINVNTVLPGFVQTGMSGDFYETPGGRTVVSSWPRKRVLDTSDLEAMILMLSSDEAASITGAEITVDNAQSLS